MIPKSTKRTTVTKKKDTTTLVDLGLSRRQAHIYLTLLNASYTDAKAIKSTPRKRQ